MNTKQAFADLNSVKPISSVEMGITHKPRNTIDTSAHWAAQGEIKDIDESMVDFKNDTLAVFLKQYDCWHLYKYFKHLHLELGFHFSFFLCFFLVKVLYKK